MNAGRIVNLIGILLLLACFFISSYRFLGRTVEELDPATTVLRFAHFELEDGIREALDHLSREYERLHPSVRVIQIPIPERFYPQWIKTQLIGEMAPDIVELQSPYIRDEIKGRFISPLTNDLESPNPYNAGTELESTPWRSTFIDGVNANHVISQHLLEKYGVPMTIATTRMYYNVDLIREVTGTEDPPRTFTEFIEFGHQVRAYVEKSNRVLYPIAGSKPTAPPFLDGMLASMTQSLGLKLDETRRIGNPGSRMMGIKYLEGEWDVYDRPVELGLGMIRQISTLMQPGFFLKDRNDAIFFFVQQRAVMIAASSQDYKTLLENIPFEVRAVRLPEPDSTHPVYGQYYMGPKSEGIGNTRLNLGVVNFSEHRDVAVDFLRFLTSKESHSDFVQRSGWLPSVIGVQPKKGTEAFVPFLGGIDPPTGFSFHSFGDLNNLRRLYDDYFYLLVGETGSVEAFSKAFDSEVRPAIVLDLAHSYQDRKLDTLVQDTLITAFRRLHSLGDQTGDYRSMEFETLYRQAGRESGLHQWANALAEFGHPVD